MNATPSDAERLPILGTRDSTRSRHLNMKRMGSIVFLGMIAVVGVVICFQLFGSTSAIDDTTPHTVSPQQAPLPQPTASPSDVYGTLALQDEVHHLPGIAFDMKERHFSGYLPLSNGGHIHYWLVESQDQPETDPVVLWLNGGPGASSLGGLLYENGPFTINDDGQTLARNPTSWNKHANMLYIEAPVGVGFSYNISGEYTSGDIIQAEENYQSLLYFFNEKFPHLKSNDFYITGESYGGVYVPTLAEAVVRGNSQQSENTINLKGFAVGNGLNEFSVNSQLYFAYYHGLIGGDLWKELQMSCPELREFHVPNYTFFDLANQSSSSPTDACTSKRMEAYAVMMTSHVNSYDIYRKCSHGDPNYGIDQLVKKLMNDTGSTQQNSPLLTHPLGLPMSLCLNNTAGTNYLNSNEVKEAIHVPMDIEWADIVMTNVSLPGLAAFHLPTQPKVLNYGMPLSGHVTQIWDFLLKNQIRGLIYHGDIDFMCDFIGGQWAVDSLGYQETVPYQPWHVRRTDGQPDQTAGFYKQFEHNLTFLTVKGAGHMVPQWKPQEALEMFERFVLQRNAD